MTRIISTSNPHVLAGLTTGKRRLGIHHGTRGNWHPLTWLSLMLDAELFGKGPPARISRTCCFTPANTVLLFPVAPALDGGNMAERVGGGAVCLASVARGIRGVGCGAQGRLSTFFGLLSLWLMRVMRKEQGTASWEQARISSTPTSNAQWCYWLALLFFALGLMSKPMLVTLPFVMLLLDWWPLGRMQSARVRGSSVRRLVREKIPFFVLSAVSCVVTFIVQQKSGAVAALTRISTVAADRKRFCFLRPVSGQNLLAGSACQSVSVSRSLGAGLVVFSVPLVIGFSVAAVWLGRKLPFIPVGWFWFVGTLVPVIGLVQVGVQSMADRYTYLPLIGVFMVLVWGLDEAVCQRGGCRNHRFYSWRRFSLADRAAWATRSQLDYWPDSETLFRHTLAVTENNYRRLQQPRHLAVEKGATGRRPWTVSSKSLRINPDNPTRFTIWATSSTRARPLGRSHRLIIDRALQVTPDQADILNNLGFALQVNQKQYAEAMANFDAALKVNPDSPSAHNNLATVLFIEHRFDEAARHYREALRHQPDNPQIYSNLGDTLVATGADRGSGEDVIRRRCGSIPTTPKSRQNCRRSARPFQVEKFAIGAHHHARRRDGLIIRDPAAELENFGLID